MTSALDKWIAVYPRLLQYRRWPEDIGAGLTFEGAMMRYGAVDRQLAARIFMNVHNDLESPDDYNPGPIGAYVDKAYPELPDTLSQYLGLRNRVIEELLAGRLFARGFRLGSLEECTPPATWWTSGTIDIRANTVSAHGTTISGLMIFENAAVPVSDDADDVNVVKHSSVKRASLAQATAWMLLAAKGQDRPVKRDDIVERCKNATNCTIRTGRKAYAALPDRYKLRPGEQERTNRTNRTSDLCANSF